MNFYPFHIGDYASATRHLTWEEDLAYRRLIDAYYTREEPIPLDKRQAYRLVCASTDEQREAVDSVLGEFFKETGQGYTHKRCDEEIAVKIAKSEKASRSAKARWDAEQNNDESHSERIANALRTVCETVCEMDAKSMRNRCYPLPNTQHPTPKRLRSPLRMGRFAPHPPGMLRQFRDRKKRGPARSTTSGRHRQGRSGKPMPTPTKPATARHPFATRRSTPTSSRF